MPPRPDDDDEEEQGSEEESEEEEEELSDDALVKHIEVLVDEVDIDKTPFKKFVQLLSKKVGQELKERKKFIKFTLTDVLTKRQEADQSSEEEEEEESEDDEEERSSAKSRKRGGTGGVTGLNAVKPLSKKLARLLGKSEMARTEVVKSLWEYIRQNELQNPSDKREILLDDKLQNVFGCESFTMFTINKYIGAHIHPFKPVDLTPSATPKSKAKGTKRRATGGATGSEKKKRKPGTQPPYRLSDELAEITGHAILPRPQVVSKIWEYIKANNLQNPNDKREIICNDQLASIMSGERKVTMFNMNTHISKHLIEKVDKSLYKANADGDGASDNDDD